MFSNFTLLKGIALQWSISFLKFCRLNAVSQTQKKVPKSHKYGLCGTKREPNGSHRGFVDIHSEVIVSVYRHSVYSYAI